MELLGATNGCTRRCQSHHGTDWGDFIGTLRGKGPTSCTFTGLAVARSLLVRLRLLLHTPYSYSVPSDTHCGVKAWGTLSPSIDSRAQISGVLRSMHDDVYRHTLFPRYRYMSRSTSRSCAYEYG